MKKIIAIISIFIFSISYSQDISGKLGTGGKFIIRDTNSIFLTLYQSNGTFSLSEPAGGNLTGSIFKGTSRFLHTFFPNSTTGYNTFLGIESGNFTMTGTGLESTANTGTGYQTLTSLTTGSHNSAFGLQSLFSNTTGSFNCSFGAGTMAYNTSGKFNAAYGNLSMTFNTTGDSNSAVGFHSLFSNTAGNSNSAFGNKSLYTNSTGFYNSAFGSRSLFSNTTGFNNDAFGYGALGFNLIGGNNSAFGSASLYNNTSGTNNSAFGRTALHNNTIGANNCAFGPLSLYNNVLGNHNTAIGYQSGSNITSGSNNITIGYDAFVPSATGSNQIRIGNTNITYAGIQVPWTITSDRRWKDNIKPVTLGLNFISLLNPVSYTRKNDETQKTELGLIAQEFEKVLNECGVTTTESGMLSVDEKGNYELRYNDLFAPVIKAIQELKTENDLLKEENLKEKERLNAEISLLKNELAQFKSAVIEVIENKRNISEIKNSESKK